MKVVAVASRKGGVGKSLICRCFSVSALLDEARSAIIDCDPQGTILDWAKRREPPAPRVFPLDGTIENTLKTIRKGKPDYVFIDTPPSVHPIIDMAVQVSDAAFIVTGPYPEDLAAIGSSVQIIKSRKKRAGIILNRTPTRAAALSLARSALGVFELPVCQTAMVQRVAHPYAASNGLTASEWEPEGAAAKEIEQVWAWMKGIING